MQLGACEACECVYVGTYVRAPCEHLGVDLGNRNSVPLCALHQPAQPPPQLLSLQQRDWLLLVSGRHPRFSPITGCNIRTEVHFPLCVVFIQHSDLKFSALKKMFKLECFFFSSEHTHEGKLPSWYIEFVFLCVDDLL